MLIGRKKIHEKFETSFCKYSYSKLTLQRHTFGTVSCLLENKWQRICFEGECDEN